MRITPMIGRRLAANTPGEVAVCGSNVMRGYRNNPEANAVAFIDGWFRTKTLVQSITMAIPL
jgi:long-subunit acyl-CoA synthetase (AMP-forming)